MLKEGRGRNMDKQMGKIIPKEVREECRQQEETAISYTIFYPFHVSVAEIVKYMNYEKK